MEKGKGGIMIISDLNPKAQFAGVTDGEDVEIMINGSARDIMKMIEQTVTRIVMMCYKDAQKKKGDEEATKSAAETMQTFLSRVSKSVMFELTKERLGSSFEDMPDDLRDVIAGAIASKFAGGERDQNEDDDNEEEGDEE